jgi:hypothetical protein
MGSASEAGGKLWVTLLNQESEIQNSNMKTDFTAFRTGKLLGSKVLNNTGTVIKKMETNNDWEISVPALGLVVVEFEFEK